MTMPSGRRILLVEDDPMVRRLLTRHFQRSETTVVEAANAEEGIAAFTQAVAPFDVVVTDVHLPGRTGLELATELRMQRKDQAIVFITGDVDEKLARRALEGGQAGYLLKPFEFFELDAAITQAVQSAATAPASPSRAQFSPADRTAWYAEQRRSLEAAAQRPLDVRLLVHGRRAERWRAFAKLAITVLVLLGFAWVIGYALYPQKDNRPAPEVGQPAPVSERTIYMPAPEERPRDSRDTRERRR